MFLRTSAVECIGECFWRHSNTFASSSFKLYRAAALSEEVFQKEHNSSLNSEFPTESAHLNYPQTLILHFIIQDNIQIFKGFK